MTKHLPNEVVEGSIERLAFGGQGILRTKERFVIFVPFTLPGEIIQCRITKSKKNFAEAELIKILQPSPHRIKPLCPCFGICGGCQLQHMDYPTQLSYKQACVQEAIEKVFPEAKIILAPADSMWNYRRHISWTIRNGKQGIETGYIGIDNHSLVSVKECPIFLSSPAPFLQKVSKLVEQFEPVPDMHGKVSIVKSLNNQFVLLFRFKKAPKNAQEICMHALNHEKTIAGISISSPAGEISMGDFDLNMEIDDLRFHYHPAAFVQNNPEQSLYIYQLTTELIAARKPKYLLDLYSGIGISSLLAAKYAEKVDGVEWNLKAVELAKKNAVENGITHVNFHASAVEAILPSLLKKQPEMVIVNPPRLGLTHKVAEALSTSSIRELIYISCHPATLARDLKIFEENGFSLELGKAFDMFPQTGHVESLMFLKRPCA